jgi:hypothetical protein
MSDMYLGSVGSRRDNQVHPSACDGEGWSLKKDIR